MAGAQIPPFWMCRRVYSGNSLMIELATILSIKFSQMTTRRVKPETQNKTRPSLRCNHGPHPQAISKRRKQVGL